MYCPSWNKNYFHLEKFIYSQFQTTTSLSNVYGYNRSSTNNPITTHLKAHQYFKRDNPNHLNHTKPPTIEIVTEITITA